ncbi:hypothetical protein PE143B_0104105 [Pseudomonas extremaustralis 14-3 substr. 14-3b]|nr:hypothetical protein PE143B_0104105 [Pseudomonas extremaustralis 14-3 substr. 14-3b]
MIDICHLLGFREAISLTPVLSKETGRVKMNLAQQSCETDAHWMACTADSGEDGIGKERPQLVEHYASIAQADQVRRGQQDGANDGAVSVCLGLEFAMFDGD